MRYILSALLVFSVLLTFAQSAENREIESFDKIEVFGNIKVEMKQGETESLWLKTKNIDLSDVETEVKDRKLKINTKSNLFEDEAEVIVKLTYVKLREISSNASAEIKILDKIKGDKLFATATSGGRILMEVDLNAIELKSNQGAHIDIKGKCKVQESFINTGGVLAAAEFRCKEVYIKMNTGGKAEVVADEKIEANVNTGANLSFFGKPTQKNLNSSLGGDITDWERE
mgnify:CR=1 FL=1